jgi:tripeptide aminopeptidase
MNNELDFLKSVLSVPTVTYNETLMVKFIANWLKENDIPYYIDSYHNIYATKGNLNDDSKFYPCVISHTDTVHNIDTINVKEEYLKNAQKELKLSLKAYNDEGKPTGIGGDDKCGVFACLKMLKDLPILKAAFFVSEETGCHGSRNSDSEFFNDIGYVIQFDAPENWMISQNCSGVDLFDKNSTFFEKCNEVLTESMNTQSMRYMNHPYTDVYAITKKYGISSINFSIGYYDYHTKHEYVVVEDVFNGIEIGKKMIELLGYEFYEKKEQKFKYGIF